MNRIKMFTIGAVLIMVVIVALGWFLGVAPRLAEAKAADEERTSVEALNATYEATIARLEKLDKDLPKLERQLEDLRAALPQDAQISTLLGQLNSLAADSQVELTDITADAPIAFAPEESTEAPVAAGGEAVAEPQVAAQPPAPEAPANFITVPVKVSVTGQQSNVLDFIENVQFGTRLFLVSGLTITADGSGGKAEIVGLVYVLVDAAEEAEAVSDVTPAA